MSVKNVTSTPQIITVSSDHNKRSKNETERTANKILRTQKNSDVGTEYNQLKRKDFFGKPESSSKRQTKVEVLDLKKQQPNPDTLEKEVEINGERYICSFDYTITEGLVCSIRSANDAVQYTANKIKDLVEKTEEIQKKLIEIGVKTAITWYIPSASPLIVGADLKPLVDLIQNTIKEITNKGTEQSIFSSNSSAAKSINYLHKNKK